VTTTTQQPPPQPYQQTQPPPGGPPPSDDSGLIALIAAALTTGATVGAMVGVLLPRFYGSGIDGYGLTVGLRLVMSQPWPQVRGPASRVMARAEGAFRAAFVLNAARRVTAAAVRPAEGVSRAEALAGAVAAERRFFELHKAAAAKRQTAARAVDFAAKRVGTPTGDGRVLLGWSATLDGRTTVECRAADGTNFWADEPPVIGYPGTVHVHCRCRPVAPSLGAPMTNTVSAALSH
jgi:hypothetical protein